MKKYRVLFEDVTITEVIVEADSEFSVQDLAWQALRASEGIVISEPGYELTRVEEVEGA